MIHIFLFFGNLAKLNLAAAAASKKIAQKTFKIGSRSRSFHVERRTNFYKSKQHSSLTKDVLGPDFG
jgi:hypothetical protein